MPESFQFASALYAGTLIIYSDRKG